MIGDWIKAQRKARGWTQPELSERSGIKLGYLKQLEINERPNPGVDILAGLGRAFGVSIEDVMAGARATQSARSGPPLDQLRAVGWPDAELNELAAGWDRLSAREQSELLATAQKLYKGHEELQRRREAQQQAVAALLRRHNPAA